MDRGEKEIFITNGSLGFYSDASQKLVLLTVDLELHFNWGKGWLA